MTHKLRYLINVRQSLFLGVKFIRTTFLKKIPFEKKIVLAIHVPNNLYS